MNNALLYNAAIAGGTGGSQDQRWLVQSNSSQYQDIRNQVIAFATAVDAAIPTDSSVNESDAQLLQSICQAVLSSRYPQQLTESQFTDLAKAVAALYAELQAALSPTSGTAEPLSSALYADHGTTIAAAAQNGSINTPFQTLAEAVGVASDGYTILLAPTLGSDAYDATPINFNLAIQSVDSSLLPNPHAFNQPTTTTINGNFAIGNAATVSFTNLIIPGEVDLIGEAQLLCKNTDIGTIGGEASGTVFIEDSEIDAFTGSTIFGINSTFGGPISANTAGEFIDCQLSGALTDGGNNASFTLENCAYVSITSAFDVNISNHCVGGAITCQGAAQIQDSQVAAINAHGDGATGISALNCTILGAITSVQDITLRNVTGDQLSAISGANVTIFDSNLVNQPVTSSVDSDIENSSILYVVATGGVNLHNVVCNGSLAGNSVQAGNNTSITLTQVFQNINVTGNLRIDSYSYDYCINNGNTITVTGTLTIIDAPRTQKQLGWNPASAANSNILTLLPAGHAPGMYTISTTLILKAAATGATTIARQISFNMPNGGGPLTTSRSIFGSAGAWTGSVPTFEQTNTAAYSATATAFSTVSTVIMSDGTQPITAQMLSSGFTGTPSIDFYASVAMLSAGA